MSLYFNEYVKTNKLYFFNTNPNIFILYHVFNKLFVIGCYPAWYIKLSKHIHHSLMEISDGCKLIWDKKDFLQIHDTSQRIILFIKIQTKNMEMNMYILSHIPYTPKNTPKVALYSVLVQIIEGFLVLVDHFYGGLKVRSQLGFDSSQILRLFSPLFEFLVIVIFFNKLALSVELELNKLWLLSKFCVWHLFEIQIYKSLKKYFAHF